MCWSTHTSISSSDSRLSTSRSSTFFRKSLACSEMVSGKSMLRWKEGKRLRAGHINKEKEKARRRSASKKKKEEGRGGGRENTQLQRHNVGLEGDARVRGEWKPPVQETVAGDANSPAVGLEPRHGGI